MSRRTRLDLPPVVTISSLLGIAALLLAGSQLLTGGDATTAAIGGALCTIVAVAWYVHTRRALTRTGEVEPIQDEPVDPRAKLPRHALWWGIATVAVTVLGYLWVKSGEGDGTVGRGIAYLFAMVLIPCASTVFGVTALVRSRRKTLPALGLALTGHWCCWPGSDSSDDNGSRARSTNDNARSE